MSRAFGAQESGGIDSSLGTLRSQGYVAILITSCFGEAEKKA